MTKLLKEAIQPNGSPECGNHVAARQYSSSNRHFYWHDFTPLPPSSYSNFANYTDYVADVFKTRAYQSGTTDTAGALFRVRTEDLEKTRDQRTFIMVFTDGRSNNAAETVIQAQLLHPLVDEVYAFGIGGGISERELESIASEPDNWSVMANFQQYQEFVRLFMLGLSEGCAARIIQPYRIIDLETTEELSYGVSDATAAKYLQVQINGNCPGFPEQNRDQKECAEYSQQIAALDLEAMGTFKQNITEAANAKCFNAALLAGFISRQTQGGKKLKDHSNGWIPCDNPGNGNCYGIMHMNNNSMLV